MIVERYPYEVIDGFGTTYNFKDIENKWGLKAANGNVAAISLVVAMNYIGECIRPKDKGVLSIDTYEDSAEDLAQIMHTKAGSLSVNGDSPGKLAAMEVINLMRNRIPIMWLSDLIIAIDRKNLDKRDIENFFSDFSIYVEDPEYIIILIRIAHASMPLLPKGIDDFRLSTSLDWFNKVSEKARYITTYERKYIKNALRVKII